MAVFLPDHPTVLPAICCRLWLLRNSTPDSRQSSPRSLRRSAAKRRRHEHGIERPSERFEPCRVDCHPKGELDARPLEALDLLRRPHGETYGGMP